MFGGPLTHPKKPAPHVKNIPIKNDYHMVGYDGIFGHMAREPNTDHHIKMLHYQQRENECKNKLESEASKDVEQEALRQKFELHCDKKRFRNEIKARVHAKLIDYERSIEERRVRLRTLFGMEEREFYKETVDKAQRGNEDKFEEMRIKAAQLKATRERERLEIVHQKRLQQYMARCQELTPALVEKHLVETKECQLQQMRENEARRETEREMNRMWHHLGTLQDKAMRDRDEQDAIERYNKEKIAKEVLDMQVKGKQILKQEVARVATEDRIEMEKLAEQLRKEEIEIQRAKLRKKILIGRELKEQIAEQQKFVENRQRAEKALDSAFAQLTAMEIQREKDAIKDTQIYAKKEVAMYRQNLRELEEEKKKEQKILADMLEEHKQIVLKKQQDAQCKIYAAKEALKKSVLATRDQQLVWKRVQAEQELRLKQAENEMIQIAIDMNKKLDDETNRLKVEASKQYGEDLKSQIEYNKELTEQASYDLERQYALGRLEEERYEKQVADLIKGEFKVSKKHPFRRLLEGSDCHCPTVEIPK